MYTLSPSLIKALQGLLSSDSLKALSRHASSIHEKYTGGGLDKKLRQEEALAYCLFRMPSTYAAVCYLSSRIEEKGISFSPTSLLDIGCGPGTAYFAMKERYPLLQEALCIDHNEHFLSLFRQLSQAVGQPLPKIMHTNSQKLSLDGGHWDVGVVSYVLNEMEEKNRADLLETVMAHCSYVFLVEPGTPQGFSNIREARKKAIQQGFQILAPCPHQLACPMEQTRAWCHVRTRFERPQFQRTMKEATLNYEDEPFCYLIVHRGSSSAAPRLVDHPQKRKGHVHLSLCQPDGTLKKIVVSKKEKDRYSRAKELAWGDLL